MGCTYFLILEWEPAFTGGTENEHVLFLNQVLSTSRVRDIPGKIPGDIPGFPSSKPKENKLSREGTNFSTLTPSRGTHPTRQSPGPKVSMFSLFSFLSLRLPAKVACKKALFLTGKASFPGKHLYV